jgi:predicted metal-dependent TIM-barrel fold hydrolase
MTTMNVERIKTILLQLPPEELMALMTAIEEKLETVSIMQLAETGFQEWNDPEEDIYNEQTETIGNLVS